MWRNTPIEEYLEKGLQSHFSKEVADSYYGLYTTTKDYLCQNIYSEIKGVESQLTDHSERHIQNVLNMAWELITSSDDEHGFNIIEIYLLCTCILFHDVGNVLGRDGHQIKIADIFDRTRARHNNHNQEKQLVLRIAKAHCGKSKKGDRDTLSEIGTQSHLFDQPVRIREIAAILRFADELSEGPQRTSQYMIDKGLFSNASLIYHKYASITQVFVDKGNGRIALTYNIDYPVAEVDFKELLSFTLQRIIKLDTERRYCKYYAPSLDRIKKTEASINFLVCGDLCDYDIPKICLEDKYSLVEEGIDDLIKSIPGLDDIDTVNNKLEKLIQKTE